MSMTKRFLINAMVVVMAMTCLVPVSGRIVTEKSHAATQPASTSTQPAKPANPYANYTGWVGGKRYYYYKGTPLKGKKKVGKLWYDFDTRTGVAKRTIGDDIDMRAQRYSSKKKYLIYVSYNSHRVRIYKGKKNNWQRVKNFRCTMGKKSTRTPTGEFTVKAKGKYFNTGGNQRCWYYTQFYGNYLFHSVLYRRASSPRKITDGRLGINASHGCIRLKLSEAKWIYKYIPRKTKVVIKKK